MKKKIIPKGAALVTGGAKRIGKAIALALAEEGYDIALHYHYSSQEAKSVKEQIEQIGSACELFSCDLADIYQTSTLIKEVYKYFPDLNILVNSASIFEESSLLTGRLESLEEHLTVNFKTPFILSRDFALTCEKGHIINILDTHIVKNRTSHLTYLLSKKALYELTKLAAVELAPNIRVNGVAPGLILAPVSEKSEYLDRLAKQIPLQKKGDVGQITQSILFLLNNPYVTGQVIFVDGGEHLV